MARRKYDEDLFRDSTMTFGEHLEELRACLFKALLGLVLGFLIGLFIGNRVVEFIQTPLTNALTQYYEDKSLDDADKKLEELAKQHKAPPADREQLKHLVKDVHLLPEDIYVQPEELLVALKAKYPELLKGIVLPEKPPAQEDPEGNGTGPEAPKLTKDDFVRIFIWRAVADDSRIRVKTLNAHEAFVIYIKASLLVGALMASPWIFYQLWSFVAAGLYPHEKRYVHVFLPASLVLFLAGAAMAFGLVLEPVVEFLFSFNKWMGIDPDPRISEWLATVIMLPLGFGIAFQLPLVMLFLERIGIFTVASYISKWKIAVLTIFVMSMLLTPSDPYSMFLMAIPLLVLYAAGILACRFMPRLSSPYGEE